MNADGFREWQVRDREYHERRSITMYNKFSRCLDKFVELTFIIVYIILGVWNFISQFIINDKKANFWQTMLTIYLLFFAWMIYMSWNFNVKFLLYFGFMQGTLNKAIFLFFTACFVLPGGNQK